MKFAALAGIAAAAVYAIPAVAHHSFAMFDAGQTTTLEGTVKEFQWTNPHAWIMVTVNKQGQAQDWAIEMNGPTGLVRQGWRPMSSPRGRRISRRHVEMRPRGPVSMNTSSTRR